MNKPINVLIVDDHPFIIEAYKNAINKYSQQGYEFTISQAGDCKKGYELITDETKSFQMAMFDISMPEYAEKGIHSGEDLAKLMREKKTDCKVILLTMHSEKDKINNIIKNINPDGLIIKNDITFDELIFAIDKIIKNENYYSQTVIKLVGQAKYHDLDLDTLDTQIIYNISKGLKSTEMSNLPLSINSIESRKTRIKQVLEIPNATDLELVKVAKDKGVI